MTTKKNKDGLLGGSLITPEQLRELKLSKRDKKTTKKAPVKKAKSKKAN